tara:strand:- start:70 stop:333 length:264 start_codon:yes stop_codon:yes gene_type:complete
MRRKRIHGRRRRKCSPIKYDFTKTPAYGQKQTKISKAVVDFITPKTGAEAIAMIGTAGLVRGASAISNRFLNTVNTFKNINTVRKTI